MKYIFVGMLLNSLVTSTHDNEEACKGRAAVLKEKGVVGQCVREPSSPSLNMQCYHSNGMIGAC